MLQKKHGSKTLCQHEKYFMINQVFCANEEIPLLTFLFSSVKIYEQVPHAHKFFSMITSSKCWNTCSQCWNNKSINTYATSKKEKIGIVIKFYKNQKEEL